MEAPERPWRPTPGELEAARDRRLPDVIARDLKVLFCGINPSLYSAAVGHSFARPGNRFWPALEAARITPRRLTAFEERALLPLGYGITNIVGRATASAGDLSTAELIAGARSLEAKVRRWRPRILAFLGLTAYRIAFGDARAPVGPQPTRIGDTAVWILPNPSGLNAHYQLKDMARLYATLRRAAEGGDPCPPSSTPPRASRPPATSRRSSTST